MDKIEIVKLDVDFAQHNTYGAVTFVEGIIFNKCAPGFSVAYRDLLQAALAGCNASNMPEIQSYICEVNEILSTMPTSITIGLVDACRSIIRNHQMNLSQAISLLRKAAHHCNSFEDPTHVARILEDSYDDTPTTLLRRLVGAKKKKIGAATHKWSAKDRPLKALSRNVVAEETSHSIQGFSVGYTLANKDVDVEPGDYGDYKKYCLLMPGSSALDIAELQSFGVIGSESCVTLVEKSPREALRLTKNWDPEVVIGPLDVVTSSVVSQKVGFELAIGDLTNLPPLRLDFAWFDLLGYLTPKLAFWIQNKLFKNPTDILEADIWFTLCAVPRGSDFIQKLKDFIPASKFNAIKEQLDWGDFYTTEAFERMIILTVFLMQQIFNKHIFDIKFYYYNDSIQMMLVHLHKFESRKVARPNYIF